MSRPTFGPVLWVAALAPVLLVSGCMFTVDSSSRYRDGPLHDRATLNAIQPGRTTRDWLLDNLGPPSSSYTNDAGRTVLRYVSVEERDTEVAFLLLFAIDPSGEEIKTLHVEIQRGAVSSYWIE